jgi:SAM-dependent methyltransferase
MEFAWGTEAVDIDGRDLPALKANFVINQLPQQGHVVDVGCGGGKLLKTISVHRPQLSLSGCDIRPLSNSQSKYFDFRLIDPARGQLPYPDAYADVVLIVDVLEHVQQPVSLLTEARRILKSAGILVAFIPAEGQRFSTYRVFRKVLGRDLYAQTKDHIHAFSLADLDALLSRDFVITKKRYAYHVFGHFFDATFFAATRIPAVQRKFWRENEFYVGQIKNPSIGSSIFNWALRLANWIAWMESSFLAEISFAANGLLITAQPKPKNAFPSSKS